MKLGKDEKKTQAVAIKLIQSLPSHPEGSSYHVFVDNLSISNKFVEYARKLGIGITGTCRNNAGMVQKLIDMRKGLEKGKERRVKDIK